MPSPAYPGKTTGYASASGDVPLGRRSDRIDRLSFRIPWIWRRTRGIVFYQQSGGGGMFGIGFQEMLIILVVVLIFFGPKRLPDLAKSLGKGIAEFKKASEEVRKGIDEAVREAESEEKDSDPEHLSAYGNPPGGAPAPEEPAKTELGSTQE